MPKKKISDNAVAFQGFADRAEELGLERAVITIWVKPKDKEKCKQAMREAGAKYKQQTATLRNRA